MRTIHRKGNVPLYVFDREEIHKILREVVSIGKEKARERLDYVEALLGEPNAEEDLAFERAKYEHRKTMTPEKKKRLVELENRLYHERSGNG